MDLISTVGRIRLESIVGTACVLKHKMLLCRALGYQDLNMTHLILTEKGNFP